MPLAQLVQQDGRIFRLRIPIDVKRLDLGAQKVIGAGRAQLGEPLGVDVIDEGQAVVVILYSADEAILLGDQAAQFRQQIDQECPTFIVGETGHLRAAKCRIAFVAFRDMTRRLFDKS